MAQICMRQDFRAPAFGPASSREIYQAALDQYEWADRNGFDLLVLSEHHGIDDGWQPAPLTIAGVVLGMTSTARVMVSAVILPLHDPVRIAEQIAVLDNAAPGRLWVVVGAGYRLPEFEMAGMEHAARGQILEEYVEVLKQAWTGEPFDWRGRSVVVTPKPATEPHPTVFLGGGVPAAARRAARLRLPMLPMNTDQAVRDAYYEEAKRVGYEGFLLLTGPTSCTWHTTRGMGPDRQSGCTRRRPTPYRRPVSTRRRAFTPSRVDDLRHRRSTSSDARAGVQIPENAPRRHHLPRSPVAAADPAGEPGLFAAHVMPHLRSPRAEGSA
jgi:hypothetical protein